MEDGKNVPQRLKPGIAALFTARLKPCPSTRIAFHAGFWVRIVRVGRIAAETTFVNTEFLKQIVERAVFVMLARAQIGGMDETTF